MKTIVFIAALLLVSASARADSPKSGTWVMHLYLGDRLFDDVLQVQPSGLGWITVPDRFTVAINHLTMTAETTSFDIVADEGKGAPFHVKYEGRFYPGADTFSGFATVLDDNSLLGGFVGQRISERPAPEKLLVAGEQAVRLYDALVGQREEKLDVGTRKQTAVRCATTKNKTTCKYHDKSSMALLPPS